ncbi:HIT domain-containing protein [Blastococcus sp. MG754426]|nr:HIT domain-containing protein [Blastococcus sp. MG754426]MCF6511637.1 HIT domain-containing protein [Blastococcus sp. MG754427]
MTNDPDCPFCEIVTHEEPAREVLRTDKVVAFFPLEPATLGHTMIIPREHIPDIWSLDDQTARDLTDATLRVARAIRAAIPIDGLNIIQSNGEAATQSVFHLHVHVVPRRTDDAMGPIWPAETHWSEDDKNDAQVRIRTALVPGAEGRDGTP